jgi:6-phosphogluconolactonase
MQIRSFPNPEALAKGAADFIYTRAQECLAHADNFSLVLSGGSTPEQTYQQLVHVSRKRALNWSKVQVYWGDERCVPPDHAQSNYGMARRALFYHVPIPEENIHRMACEHDPDAGANSYEALLHSHFEGQAYPAFDFILLGLGEDGHTASLYPGTVIVEEKSRWVAPVYVPHLDSWRISLTLPAINGAAQVVFLVAGEGKAPIIKQILEPSPQDQTYPAERVKPQGDLTWLLDQAAGRLLSYIERE